MTIIQCDCGKFKATLSGFPKNTPGRLMCYCDDCQTYLHYLGRTELLDSAGGTEVIPVYPIEVEFVSGKEFLKCIRLTDGGLPRWMATCCKTPIANTMPGMPWVGVHRGVFKSDKPGFLERTFGGIRSGIHGKFAKGQTAQNTAKSFDLRGFAVVMPFMLKGFILKKTRPHPFFETDGKTPINSVEVVPAGELEALRKRLGFS